MLYTSCIYLAIKAPCKHQNVMYDTLYLFHNLVVLLIVFEVVSVPHVHCTVYA